jgi:hypothetical protein
MLEIGRVYSVQITINHTLYILTLKKHFKIYITKRKFLTKQQTLALELKKQQQLYLPQYKYYKKY